MTVLERFAGVRNSWKGNRWIRRVCKLIAPGAHAAAARMELDLNFERVLTAGGDGQIAELHQATGNSASHCSTSSERCVLWVGFGGG